ncbi:hypothetical protein [Breoghania sp. JC706]|uniref:hypothetical protein n=1 Tax=Breoghania sp. JC706 TaxID=3117732 RepID=UPI00300A4F2F
MSALTVTPLAKPVDQTEMPLPRPNPVHVPRPTATGAAAASEGMQGFGFADLVDTLNPLQQLPLIGNLYRAVTGDEISQQAHYAGSALYGMALGGPVGMGAFLGMAMVSDVVSDHLAAPEVQSASTDMTFEAEPPVEMKTVAQAVSFDDAARGAPTDLFQWLRPEAVDARFPVAASGEPERAFGDLPGAPVVPAGVDGLAADPNNHLPRGVLETLRQRHLGLLGDEQA